MDVHGVDYTHCSRKRAWRWCRISEVEAGDGSTDALLRSIHLGGLIAITPSRIVFSDSVDNEGEELLLLFPLELELVKRVTKEPADPWEG